MTPRTFTELLADSLLLFKESCAEWTAIISIALAAGLGVTAAVLLWLGLTDMTSLQAAIAGDEAGVIFPLLAAGLFDKLCGALAFVALIRAAAARDEGRALGPRQAYAEALPRLAPVLGAQARALLSILWGLVRLFWPGLKLCVLYSFVPLAAVVEDQRGAQALLRSAAVAGANPLKAFGSLAGASLLAGVAYAGLAFILNVAMTLPQTAVSGGNSMPEAVLLSFVNKLAGGLVLGWVCAFAIILYRDLAPGAQAPPQVLGPSPI